MYLLCTSHSILQSILLVCGLGCHVKELIQIVYSIFFFSSRLRFNVTSRLSLIPKKEEWCYMWQMINTVVDKTIFDLRVTRSPKANFGSLPAFFFFLYFLFFLLFRSCIFFTTFTWAHNTVITSYKKKNKIYVCFFYARVCISLSNKTSCPVYNPAVSFKLYSNPNKIQRHRGVMC